MSTTARLTYPAAAVSLATSVAAVVVTHETREEVLACVSSLRMAGIEDVVVVDCASTDGTAQALSRSHPDVRVVVCGNLGYGRAANLGVGLTVAPYVLVVNADTSVVGGLGALAEELDRHPDVAAVGPRVRYPDGRPQASARRLPSPRDAVGHAALGPWWPNNPFSRRYRMLDVDAEVARDVDWLSGCALLVRRRAFDAVGGFDPRYFMYVEDVDLAWRLRGEGWSLRYQPAAEVTHVVGAATRRRRVRMVIEHARSLDLFYSRMHPDGVGRAVRPLVRLGLLAWTLAGTMRRHPPA